MKIFTRVSSSFLIMALAIGVSTSVSAATAINLSSAGSYGVLAGSTITNTGSSVINGSLGLHPGTSLTGFPPGTSGSQQITTAQALQAQTDLATAYNAAVSQSGSTVSGDLGGQTLVAGVYTSASSLGLTGTLVLDGQGDPNAVFIFRMGSTLTTASASNVSLINGAQACNVFWQVGSSATLGTNSHLVGNVLALSSITLNTGVSVTGRVLARNGAVTLDNNSLNVPSCTVATVPSPSPTITPLTVTSTTTVVTAPVVTVPAFVGVTTVAPSMPNTGGNMGSTFPLLGASALLLALGTWMILEERKKVLEIK